MGADEKLWAAMFPEVPSGASPTKAQQVLRMRLEHDVEPKSAEKKTAWQQAEALLMADDYIEYMQMYSKHRTPSS